MPNYATYEARILGDKENVMKVVEIFQRENYEDGEHMFRIFEAELFGDELQESERVKGKHVAIITGYCAWSLATCMFRDQSSYYGHPDASSNAIDITEISKKYDVEVEMYSEEEGIGFEEYYYIKNGKILKEGIAEDLEIITPEFYDDYEEFTEEYEAQPSFNLVTKEMFNRARKDGEDIRLGGYDEWAFNYAV